MRTNSITSLVVTNKQDRKVGEYVPIHAFINI